MQECEIAWKEAHISKQRELEALAVIKEMKREILEMKTQLLDLRDFENTQKHQHEHQLNRDDTSSSSTPRITPASSSDAKSDQYPCLSFDEWKIQNNVFTPACSKRMKASLSAGVLPTPGPKQKPAATRWTSVQTPMERISSTLRHQNHPYR